MSDEQLAETAAEVLASIPSRTWEFMDEEQRDDFVSLRIFPRYMKTSADGIQLGPKFWGEALGATSNAIQKRVQRLQESQKSADGETPSTLSESEKAARRHARNNLRKADPETVREIIGPGRPRLLQGARRARAPRRRPPEPLKRDRR